MTDSRIHPLQPRRYLGLELAGAKNPKTSLSVLEFYPKEGKVFLLDVYDHIQNAEHETGDEALLETLQEVTSQENQRISKLGVNVPTELPPCIPCTKKTCPLPAKCTVPTVKWMRETVKKCTDQDLAGINIREFTPYTQRPFEIWARYHILSKLPESHRFEIDEALGGNKAPLTSRIHFLKKHLSSIQMVEVWPKLAIAALATDLPISKKTISNYRKPEQGYQSRLELLECIALKRGVFIYDRDLKKLAGSLTAFDSFLCAYIALLSDLGLTVKPPKGFPKSSTWVHYTPLKKITKTHLKDEEDELSNEEY